MDARQQKVVDAAKQVFLRHGYRRVTMGDIAEAARMSRPALYLVYPSKQEIFEACLAGYFAALAIELRAGLARETDIEKQLVFAFELWCVRPFAVVQAAPDAKDLLESGQQWAGEVVAANFAAFEAVIGQLLRALVKAQSAVRLSPIQIARLMVSAVLGFKQSAKDVVHLRQMIAGLIALVLAGLRG